MTEKQINEQLVEDINRIITIAEEWEQPHTAQAVTCKEREKAIERKMNSGKDAELAGQIKAILDSCTGRTYADKLSRSYIKYVYTLLTYRIAAAANNKLTPVHRPDDAYDLGKYLEAIARTKIADSTVTGYRALELAGSVENLAAAISASLGKPVSVTVSEISDPGYVYREKEPYLSHKIWVTTQMMPTVLIKEI